MARTKSAPSGTAVIKSTPSGTAVIRSAGTPIIRSKGKQPKAWLVAANPAESSESPPSEPASSKLSTERRKGHVLKDIRKLQMSTHLVIPALPFQRVVRQIMRERCADFRIQPAALSALHEGAEYFLYDLFATSNLCAAHAGRVVLMRKDMQLVADIRKEECQLNANA